MGLCSHEIPTPGPSGPLIILSALKSPFLTALFFYGGREWCPRSAARKFPGASGFTQKKRIPIRYPPAKMRGNRFLRRHYPNQVSGSKLLFPLSLSSQAPLYNFVYFYCIPLFPMFQASAKNIFSDRMQLPFCKNGLLPKISRKQAVFLSERLSKRISSYRIPIKFFCQNTAASTILCVFKSPLGSG